MVNIKDLDKIQGLNKTLENLQKIKDNLEGPNGHERMRVDIWTGIAWSDNLLRPKDKPQLLLLAIGCVRERIIETCRLMEELGVSFELKSTGTNGPNEQKDSPSANN